MDLTAITSAPHLPSDCASLYLTLILSASLLAFHPLFCYPTLSHSPTYSHCFISSSLTHLSSSLLISLHSFRSRRNISPRVMANHVRNNIFGALQITCALVSSNPLFCSVESRSFTVTASEAPSTNLIPLLWAQHELDYLLEDQEGNKAEILNLGRKFHIVTPGTLLQA